jgi:glutaconate CoA-transferase subunit A
MSKKLISLKDAVSEHIPDGSTVFVGGFGQCVPFAAAHEIIRQQRKNLVLCRSGADILFDLLIAAGCVRKVIFGYIGNPGVGLAHAFRRAVEAGEIEVEDWTNFAMVLRLHAGALGVPFLPTATLAGGDTPTTSIDIRSINCPFTGEALTAVPALTPDVAIIHGQLADEDGNVQLSGLSGDTQDGALASKTIIATAERIVSRKKISLHPDRTIVPGFRVAAVCHVPWGAYPAYVEGFYGRDDETYFEWDKLARDASKLNEWIDAEIRNVSGFDEYLKRLTPGRLDALAKAQGNIMENLP